MLNSHYHLLPFFDELIIIDNGRVEARGHYSELSKQYTTFFHEAEQEAMEKRAAATTKAKDESSPSQNRKKGARDRKERGGGHRRRDVDDQDNDENVAISESVPFFSTVPNPSPALLSRSPLPSPPNNDSSLLSPLLIPPDSASSSSSASDISLSALVVTLDSPNVIPPSASSATPVSEREAQVNERESASPSHSSVLFLDNPGVVVRAPPLPLCL